MPLTLIRATSNRELWRACVDGFLDQIAGRTGPGGYPAQLWLTHRLQREELYGEAAQRGFPGWLAPPISLLSDLARPFGLSHRPIGSLRRRALIARLAAERAGRYGIADASGREGGGIARAFDSLFGELLPEGVSVAELREATDGVGGDDLAASRNAWVVDTYRAYLEALAKWGRYDPRSVYSLVAERIEAGRLPSALDGAGHLHIYGLHSRRSRGRLIAALAAQPAVRVLVYVPPEVDPERPEFTGPAEWVGEGATGSPSVQPAPDGRRELEWVAGRIKALLVNGESTPERIAVVARSGREDSRRAFEALQDAGIPASARQRASLAEIPALKALLALFRAAAGGWSYRPLRDVLASAYLDTRVDLRAIDYLASARRLEGLAGWVNALRELRDVVMRQEEAGAEGGFAPLHREGVYGDRMVVVCERFDELCETFNELDGDRALDAWIDLTKRLLRGSWAKGLRFRERICDADGLDYEVVRLDQQGVQGLIGLLDDWSDMGDDEELEAGAWYRRLRRFLESNELALTTPLRTGVRVLEAHEAALFPFEHVFLVHANDGEFPRRWIPGPIFSDEERVELAERGLPLAHRALDLRREQLLWRAATAVPNLTVSYRTADHRGTPLLPSLLVPPHAEVEEISRARFVPEEPLNTPRVVQAAARTLAAGGGSAEAADPHVLRKAVLSAHAEARRRPAANDPEASSSPWNGYIRDPLVLARIRDRFAPGYRWSASSLERYGTCPFFFLLDNVLLLAGREEAEEETTPLVSGSIAHDVLKGFYERVSGELPATLDASVERAFDEVFEEVCERRELDAAEVVGEWLGRDSLWWAKKEALRADLRDYLSRELVYLAEKGERPALFEYAFGYGEDEVIVSWPDVGGVERTMRVCGRIDRVDSTHASGKTVYHVLDYKSGATPRHAGYLDGATLQAPLYMKVLAERESVEVGSGRYRSLKPAETIRNSAIVRWGSEEFHAALSHAVSIPERVRGGEFPVSLAPSQSWAPWHPGLDVRRCDEQHGEGSRFDADE